MRVLAHPFGHPSKTAPVETDHVASAEVIVAGLRVHVYGGGAGAVTVAVSPFGVRDPGGPDRLLTEVHNLNGMQAAFSFRAVDGQALYGTTRTAVTDE